MSSEFETILNDLKETYKNRIEIFGRGFENNAECISIHSNGDIYVTPYFESQNNEKCFGNIFSENPQKIYDTFKNNKLV